MAASRTVTIIMFLPLKKGLEYGYGAILDRALVNLCFSAVVHNHHHLARAAENYFSFDNFILKNDWILSQLHALSLVTHFLSHTPNPILNPAFA